MKFLLSGLMVMLLASCAGPRVRVLHYNIKELTSYKLRSDDEQFQAVKEILALRPFDLLSIQEIQYDLPQVPTPEFKTRGENLGLFAHKVGLDVKDWQQSFAAANTGMRARKKNKSEYATDPANAAARALADQVDFGLFPGQYSSGLLSRYPIVSTLVIRELPWRDFNPQVDLAKFQAGDAQPLPKDMALFDKNFSDTVVEIEGRKVHVITLHAVPSYHFGNPRSPNYERNRDQLRFLEWYLTGKTDIEVNLPEVSPLAADALYIVMGDLNADWHNEGALGTVVLKRLAQKSKLWLRDPSYSNEGSGFGANPFRLMLDYIFVAPAIKVHHGLILHAHTPRRELGCFNEERDWQEVILTGTEVVAQYQEAGKFCYSVTTELDQTLKKASDHYPIWAELELP